MDINDIQLRDIWQQAAQKMVAVQTNGGKRGDSIYFSVGSGSVQGTCLNDVLSGSAIALLTDLGNWYLLGEEQASTLSNSSRVIEYRQTRPKKIDTHLIPILFSTSEEPEYWHFNIQYKCFIANSLYYSADKQYYEFYCGFQHQDLYFEAPPKSTFELIIDPPAWIENAFLFYPNYSTYVDVSHGSPTPSSNGGNGSFNYQRFYVKYTAPDDIEGFYFKYDNLFLRSCYDFQAYSPAERTGDSWDDTVKHNCTWEIYSQSFTQISKSEFPEQFIKNYKKLSFYLGGDRPKPLDLNTKIFTRLVPLFVPDVNDVIYEAYISALGTNRYITIRHKQVFPSSWEKIILIQIEKNKLSKQVVLPGDTFNLNKDDWRTTYVHTFATGVHCNNFCIDFYSFYYSTVNLNTRKNLLYTWLTNKNYISYAPEGYIDGIESNEYINVDKRIKTKNIANTKFQVINFKTINNNSGCALGRSSEISTNIYKLIPGCFIHSVAPYR